MKGFVICFTVYVACFVSGSDGLKCYECSDVYPDLSTNCSSAHTAIRECGEFLRYCGTATSTNNQSSSTDCGDNCVIKGCEGAAYCAEPTKFELTGLSFTVECCQGDLCNSSARLPETNLFICIKLFSLILLLCKVL